MKHNWNNRAVCRAVMATGLAALCSMLMPLQSADSIEVKELKAALSRVQGQLEVSQRDLAQSGVQRKALLGGLAEAVRVSEEQVAAARETQLKLQAFGIDLFTQDEKSLEQRLLKAVRDLDIYQQDIEKQAIALHSLSEAFLKFVQAAPEVNAVERDAAMLALEKASSSLSHSGQAVGKEVGDISNSQVVSIDSEIGLVVFDAGNREGLRIGTPITVLREDRPIYTAMIVDVREAITGAVLQDRLTESAEVAVGDGIRLQPNQFNF
tara:strand:+ start:2252 stop:3049 length:798 start_codon:yes stop_codon:yes gene_type:complete